MRIRVGDLSKSAQAQVAVKAAHAGASKATSSHSSAEDTFEFQCRVCDELPRPERQFRFAESIGRQWRFDFAWPRFKCALEVEGLALYEKERMNGHTSLEGFEKDCEKYASAAIMGWAVIRFTQRQVGSGFALDCAIKLLRAKGWHDEQVQEETQAAPARPEARAPTVVRGSSWAQRR